MENATDMMRSYVRVAGRGLRFIPAPPYTVYAVAAGLEVIAEVDQVERRLALTPTSPRGAFAYGAVSDGPSGDTWRVEVGGVYTTRWPARLQLRSWPTPEEPPFFAFGDGAGSVVYPQGPFPASRAPNLDAMIYEGQQVIGRDADDELSWIDLSYDHEGTVWQQRHIIAPLPPERTMVVTVQTKGSVAGDILAAGLDVARSLRPYTADTADTAA